MSEVKQGCKEKIFRDWHSYSCKSKEWKDGFCKTHHPETKAARIEKRNARWNEEDQKRREANELQKVRNRKADMFDDVEKQLAYWKERAEAAEKVIIKLVTYEVQLMREFREWKEIKSREIK